jgi:hypothetical protein
VTKYVLILVDASLAFKSQLWYGQHHLCQNIPRSISLHKHDVHIRPNCIKFSWHEVANAAVILTLTAKQSSRNSQTLTARVTFVPFVPYWHVPQCTHVPCQMSLAHQAEFHSASTALLVPSEADALNHMTIMSSFSHSWFRQRQAPCKPLRTPASLAQAHALLTLKFQTM